MTRHRIGAAIVAVALGGSRMAAADGLAIDLEGGVVGATRNDVRVPGDGGTRFSLVDDVSAGVEPAFRVRLGYRFSGRHLLSMLYAPLSLEGSGTVDGAIDFAGARFDDGEPVHATYRFDSYRLTYRYDVVRREGLEVGVGVTGKIRDAEIALHGAQRGRKTNTGFVPLLNLHLGWRPGGGDVGLVVDADALAAPQGRAEDVLVAAAWAVRDGVTARVGYRMVEGGADNDEVYTFAWLHYAVAGLEVALR